MLTGTLGYTDQEVSRIDPDMADLAIERKLRRPASGMPPDWAFAASTGDINRPLPSAPVAEDDEFSVNGDGGALDLDEILGREPQGSGSSGRGGAGGEREATGGSGRRRTSQTSG